VKKDRFNNLVKSLKEAKEISKGENEPSRVFRLEAPDAKAVRKSVGLLQSKFANLM
jgi:putative transcriptional regulator